MWASGEAQQLDKRIALEFTKKTGVPVRFIPASESASRRLAQETALLDQKSTAVDVLQVDITWPGIMANDLVDLKDALKDNLAGELPQAVENATIGGRLVAAPLQVGYGMLYYRTDLIRKYGFSDPPRTWDELETQASRIQQGERASGHADFWGYVWQGADYEGLTCNALEWQSSHGGGNFLEKDHTVNVNNPAAIRAFERAAHWVGVISPPGVLAFFISKTISAMSGKAEGSPFCATGVMFTRSQKVPQVGNRFAIALCPLKSISTRVLSVDGIWESPNTALIAPKQLPL